MYGDAIASLFFCISSNAPNSAFAKNISFLRLIFLSLKDFGITDIDIVETRHGTTLRE